MSLCFQEHPGHGLRPLAYCLLPSSLQRPGTSFPPHQSPQPLHRHRSATVLTILSPAPCPGAQPATQAPSINNRSGPTDHSPTVGPALSPPGARSKKLMAPLLGLRPGAPGRKHQLPTDSEPGRAAGWSVAWWAADSRLRAAGLASRGVPVLTGGTRGNPSILHACNIQPSSEPVRSPASVGASAEPLRMGRPVRGRTDSGRAQGSGLPPELQEPWVSPLP